MKKLYLITFFVILISSIIQSQCINQNPVPDSNDLWSTFFIDDTGWIVGSGGFIKKTTNAGVDWIEQKSGTTAILKSVQFINLSTGWICGEGGLILKTTNGGSNWFSLTSGTTEHLTDIHFCDPNTGYVVGYGGTILKTTDGGSAWVSQSSGTSIDLYSVDFVDALLGYAVGGMDPIAVLKTTDGGTSWIDKSSGITENKYLLAVEFIDANTGVVGGGYDGDDFIYKTTDGGDTWIVVFTPWKEKEQNHREQLSIYIDRGGINSIYFKDSNIGYAVSGTVQDCNGYRHIYTTTDGGSTWNISYVDPDKGGLISVCVNTAGQGWAVGFKGVIVISEDNGNSWAQILSGKGTTYSTGDDIYSVFFINENIGWAVGARNNCNSDDGIILKTTNGGKIWKTQKHFPYIGGPITSVYFINEDIGWAVGEEGVVQTYRTTDGGENWIDVGGPASSVFFINQDTGWKIRDWYSDGIYKSTDGGDNWVQKSSISSSSVYFSDINNGWAVGEGGSILKSTDEGETWIAKTSGTTSNLNSVHFYNNNIGMCVGNNGTVLLSTDGGESWITQNVGITDTLTAVTFTNPSTVWIAGKSGTILNTADLGYSWVLYNEVTENDLASLSFINEHTGWIGGMNGTMFKYQNGVVPVELISFTANVNNDLVQLNWKTATEINNYGFEIERGEGVYWKKIGFIEGHGNSNSPKEYSFTDKNLIGGSKFYYRLIQIDNDGKYEYSNEIEVEIGPTKFTLFQNYPNPFNPSTVIKFAIPNDSNVNLSIYSMLGELVTTLVNGQLKAGNYEYEFDASGYSSGVYLFIIKAGDFIQTKKMVLMK